MDSPLTVADVCTRADAVLSDETEGVSATGLVLIGDPACGLVHGVVASEYAAESPQAALLVPGSLPLDRAFRVLLEHPTMRWLVTETGGVVARERIIPPSLDHLGGTRHGLSGDPVAPGSGLAFRCPAEPDDHVFSAPQIEVWTTDLKARCPVDGRVMTAFLPEE
ncbi:hypothetical protein ACFV7R_45225 [Streptomyces sp. NPDC059866]|uniref:hypothetical protein n=1 Tax=Streptomyces sp. NPDC059866 TaxID=3346978 RepID=UPI00364ED48F